MADIPRATYRLQFSGRFTFGDARAVVGYLAELGISHVYASSWLAAREGSDHGYDVVNPTIINREIGSDEELREMVAELRRHGMGHVVDFVPNHMCIESVENVWWMDVLENGQSSPHARFFDIDWQPVKKELTSRVLLPFLADQYGRVLEKGDLRLIFEKGAFWVAYFQMRMPLEPKSCSRILEHRLDLLRQRLPPDATPLMDLLSIITHLQHLPPHTESDPERREERGREKEIIKKRLARLCMESPVVDGFIRENLEIFNGVRGDSRSFDLLDGLLRDQVYRLSHWRVATEEINYRRFFDINGLAAIRVEDDAVFCQTHSLLVRLIREGVVTGVRIDHVDGLYDPLTYLHRLQGEVLAPDGENCPAGGEREGPAGRNGNGNCFRPLYLLCEKILLKGEHLPEEWPVHGTTGYDFLAAVNGIFVDPENARAFDRIYRRFTGLGSDFSEIARSSKKLVMEVALSGEVNMLANRLSALSERDRQTRDFTLNSLARAISEVVACFPVYRTYLNSWNIREKDSQYIEAAIGRARRRNPAVNDSIFDFLRAVLLVRLPDDAAFEVRDEWLNFAMRFQQLTGPVMAKGMEDTAFYVYNRLISLNEVGGMPGRFGTPLEAFHGQNMERMKSFPHSLNATATHDTKRGEDGRMRINVLSEIPELWQAAIGRWNRINRRRHRVIDNQRAPDQNEEYLLYQTLVGVWPNAPATAEVLAVLRSRMRDYLTKAVREAKINSSWVSPNSSWEEALISFCDGVLDPAPGNPFLRDFIPFQEQVARCGMYGSLSQTLLKMTSPGVPDFYQGTELWDYSLVDPDNRRPVDYVLRREMLARLRRREAENGPLRLAGELLANWKDGSIKLQLIRRCLAFRHRLRELFERGSYGPLETAGPRSRNVCAFIRRLDGRLMIVAVGRLLAGPVIRSGVTPVGAPWKETFLLLPEFIGRLTNVITGEELEPEANGMGARLAMEQVFSVLPVALLTTEG